MSGEKVTEFSVEMSCQGCANACTRILNKIEGVENVDANVEEQKIRVKGSAASNQMLEALRKWGEASGKKVELAS